MKEKNFLVPTIGLDAIKILGNNMYSNSAYAIAELIANAHDANAENVSITMQDRLITILDDGSGMSVEDLEYKYLNIGSDLRGNKDERKMGRKGIGKLASLFISNEVRILTKKGGIITGLLLSLDKNKLSKDEHGKHGFPIIEATKEERELLASTETATLIKLIEPTIELTPEDLSYYIEDMFESGKINIEINGNILENKPKTIPDCVVGVVTIGGTDFLPDEYKNLSKAIYKNYDSPIFDGYQTSISGWVVVLNTIDKNILNDNNIKERPDINKVSIFSRGKLGMKDMIPIIDKSRVADRYISGRIDAPVFEEGDQDMALPNRQGYSTKDPRFTKAMDIIGEATRHLSGVRARWAEEKNRKKKEYKQKENAGKAAQLARESVNEISNSVDLNISQQEVIQEIVQKQIESVTISNVSEPVLLVSHSEKDLVHSKLIGDILTTLGFIKPGDEEAIAPRALISSLDGWNVESGVDFWEWVIKNCIQHTSNTPGRMLILSSKNSNSSFNVGVEAGIARAASSKTHKRVITVDKTDFNDVKGIFKNSAEQVIPCLPNLRGKESEVKSLTDNIWALIKTYSNFEKTKEDVTKAVKKSLRKNKKELDAYYAQLDKKILCKTCNCEGH